MSRSRILGPAGQDNYRMENCPFHLPKDNLNFFYEMQDNAEKEPYTNYKQYGNAYKPDWKNSAKPSKDYLRVMEAI